MISECNARVIAMAFDCEGTIGLSTLGDPRCIISNTDLRLLEYLQGIAEGAGTLTGPYLYKLSTKGIYTWRLRTIDLPVLLAAIEPYLIVKRNQARLILAMRDAVEQSKPIDTRRCVATMRELNGNSKRGRPMLEPSEPDDGKVSGLDFI